MCRKLSVKISLVVYIPVYIFKYLKFVSQSCSSLNLYLAPSFSGYTVDGKVLLDDMYHQNVLTQL